MGPRGTRLYCKLSPINERLLLILVATVRSRGKGLASTTIDVVDNIRKESPNSDNTQIQTQTEQSARILELQLAAPWKEYSDKLGENRDSG